MGDRPFVSIIIPARNEEASISFAVGGVAAQTYPHDRIEIAVIDGGSTDRTAAVAAGEIDGCGFARFAVLDNPIGSTPTNLNMGLDWSQGDIVVRIDARSCPPPDYVERLVEVMSDPSIAVSGGSQIAMPRSESLLDQGIARALNNRWGMGGSSYRRAGAPSGTTDTVYLGVFNRSQLAEAGGWNPDYPTNQDFELNQRMMQFGSVWFEAGLPVAYIPRADLRSLVAQYHRFGRWKATYWSKGNRPGKRQWVLLGGPTIALLAAAPLAWLMVTTIGVPLVVALVLVVSVGGVLTLDALGGHNSKAGLCTRALAGCSNVAIGASWYFGVVRQMLTRGNATSTGPKKTMPPRPDGSKPSSSSASKPRFAQR